MQDEVSGGYDTYLFYIENSECLMLRIKPVDLLVARHLQMSVFFRRP